MTSGSLTGVRLAASGHGERLVPVRYQLVIDCLDPDVMARFWAAALGYVLAPVPAGFDTWPDFYRALGVPEEDLVLGADRISDPAGVGPDIWFHQVSEAKTIKNRLHFDLRATAAWTDPREIRRELIEAEADRLVALGARRTGALSEAGSDFYAVGMRDPEDNEFDIN